MVVSSIQNDDHNCIDPNVVIDASGKPWLSFGSFWSGIKLVRLDASTGKPTGPLLHIAGRNGGAIEAPFIVLHQRWYYLFVSFDQCCKGTDSTYKLMVGRSRSVEGPYLAFDGKRMTDGGGTLVLAGYGDVKGPGHNGFISLPEGDFLIHHYYDARSHGVPTMQIRPVLWSQDGWPVIGGPISELTKTGKAPMRSRIPGKWTHIVEAGNGSVLELKPNGQIGDGPAKWSLTGNVLEMKWPRNDAPNGVWVDQCFVGQNADWYAGRNQKGMLIRGVRKEN